MTLWDGETWSYGFDVSLGAVVNKEIAAQMWVADPFHNGKLNALVENLNLFDTINESFSHEECLKIGIVACEPGSGKKDASEVGMVGFIAAKEKLLLVLAQRRQRRSSILESSQKTARITSKNRNFFLR